MLRDKNNSGGLIKLLHFSSSADQPIASAERTKTFANIGLVVPDVVAAQQRLDRYSVTIVKRVGETDLAVDGPVAKAFGVGPTATSNVTEVEEIVKGLIGTDLENLLFVLDPDGNMLEVVEQNGF